MTYSKIFSMFAALAVSTGGLIAITPSASAKDQPLVVFAPPDAPTRRVSYADLNLTSQAAEKMLYRRVAGAVRSVCNEATGPFSDFNETTACRDFAWDGARPQINRAVARAHEYAANGSTTVVAVQAIVLAVPK